MIACAGAVTFFAFTGFFLLALILMRIGVDARFPLDTGVTPPLSSPSSGPRPRPYDWEREGI